MNCIEFEAALAGQHDARIPLPPEAAEHITVCSECCQQWWLNAHLNTAIQAWRSVDDAPDLVDRVLSELANPSDAGFDWQPLIQAPVLADANRPKGRPVVSSERGQVALLASIAACVIVSVIFVTQQQQSLRLAEHRNFPPAKAIIGDTLLDVSSTLSEVFSDLGSEYREIAEETQLAARDLARVLPQVNDVSIRSEAVQQTDSRSVSTEAAQIWRPISSRVETALGFLWQAIPSEVPAG